MTIARSIAAALIAAAAATGAQAACETPKAADDLTLEEARALYDCIAPELFAGYNTGPKMWIPAETVAGYRNWTSASALPGKPGFHSNRFLMTWVNEVGAAEYLKYDEDAAKIPAGTKIAKESFEVNADGKVVAGPLFFMEKVAEGVSTPSGDWYYYMVAPNGAPQAVDVMTACVECHLGNYGYRDSMGFPIEEARVRK